VFGYPGETLALVVHILLPNSFGIFLNSFVNLKNFVLLANCNAQNRTEQNRTEQNRTEQNRTEQNRTEQNRNLGTCNRKSITSKRN
jgi:hypothetical protein